MKSRNPKLFVLVLLVLLMNMIALPTLTESIPTLTIFVEECVTIEDFETNAATKWVEEKLNCSLDFIVAPQGAAEEKMNILLNSGDYPDIFMKTVPSENLYGIESGILLDLSDYISNPERMPNFIKAMEMRPSVLTQIKAVDGKVYSLPAYNECGHCQFANKMFYNKALLDELGIQAPSSIDEFYNALVAFKSAYPEGIPLVGCTDAQSAPWAFLTNAWTYSSLSNGDAGNIGLRLHSDKIETIVNTEEYREALDFLNKLFDEELLYEGSFTMDGPQLKALLASNTPVLFWGAYHNVQYVDGTATPELYANQKPLAPLSGPNGARFATYYIPSPVPGFAITKACENIELALEFADLHYSIEGFWVTNEGVEGEHWNYAAAGEVTLTGKPAIANRTGPYINTLHNVKWEPRAVNWQIEEICGSSFDPETYDENDPADGAKYRAIMTNELYWPCYQTEFLSIPTLKFTSDEEEELSMLTISLENYIAASRVSFITGELDLDSDWDAYVSSLSSMGIDRVVELYQGAYDRVK
jgi:putative aldouronate transport system substrate-binding protein